MNESETLFQFILKTYINPAIQLVKEFVSWNLSQKRVLEYKLKQKDRHIDELNKHIDELTKTLNAGREFLETARNAVEDALETERSSIGIPALLGAEEVQVGASLQRLDELKEKLQQLEKAGIKPTAKGYFELGMLAYYTAQYEDAVKFWKNADSFNAHYNLGVFYGKKGLRLRFFENLFKGRRNPSLFYFTYLCADRVSFAGGSAGAYPVPRQCD